MESAPVTRPAPAAFRGEWLEPDAAEYDTARRIYNTRFDPHPLVIARCRGTADVVAAVRYAREHQLALTVRATGQSLAGYSHGDNTMVIDLSGMYGVRVDPRGRTAWLQGGARGGDVLVEASLHGLGSAAGMLSSTGAGLMLGGGIGPLSRRIGYASDNVLEVELVTAEGEVVTASPEENSDLFWAVRGTSGNFGVVTALKVALHEVPPVVLGGTLSWTGEKVKPALKAIEDASEWASDEFSLLGLTSPGLLELWVGHTGPGDVAAKEVQRVIDTLEPDENTVREMSFLELSTLHDNDFVPQRIVFDEETVSRLDDELIDRLLEAFEAPMPGAGEDAPGTSENSAFRDIEFYPRTRGLSRAPKHPNALHDGIVEPCWSIGVAVWFDEPSDDDFHRSWVDETLSTIRASGLTTGNLQPTYFGSPADQERVARVYGDRYERLRELKTTWDPENVFRANLNIQP